MTAIVKHTIRSNQAAAGTAAPAQPRNSQLRRQFPPRQAQASWPATARDQDEVLRRLTSPPFLPKNQATRAGRRRGTAKLLRWLSSFPGDTWQQRWEASGSEDHPGSSWASLPLGWLRESGLAASYDENDLSSGLLMLICGDVIRPRMTWMVTRAHRHLAPVMAGTRDPAGFARLRELAESGPSSALKDARLADTRIATILACKGGVISDITVGDSVEMSDAQRLVHSRGGQKKVDFYLRLHALGIFPADAPATIRAFGMAQGQVTVEELVDRYRLQCKPVRDLLVDYLKERQPALDYASLDSASRTLAGLFWARVEALSPGIDTLRLPPDVARAWKEDVRTIKRSVTGPDGSKTVVTRPRINAKDELIRVRALYLDIAQWAMEEP
ncbi:MAG: site-specific integrase, partial [Actinomycetes bacterium]